MSSFVRFIFFVLIAGILLNLTIVVFANVKSERRREAELRTERDAFTALLSTINGRLRRADIAVEWQTIDAAERCLETSLLVRQYYLTAADDSLPLPIVRVKVPGNRILVDGLFIECGALFSRDNQNLQVFRNTRLAYFDRIYTEEQSRDKAFRFLTENQVPALTRIDPVLVGEPATGKPSFPSIYELQMWQRLWDYIKLPSARRPHGFTVTPLPPVAREVRRGQVYAAFAGPDGITLELQTTSGLLTSMREEADKLPK